MRAIAKPATPAPAATYNLGGTPYLAECVDDVPPALIHSSIGRTVPHSMQG